MWTVMYRFPPITPIQPLKLTPLQGPSSTHLAFETFQKFLTALNVTDLLCFFFLMAIEVERNFSIICPDQLLTFRITFM